MNRTLTITINEDWKRTLRDAGELAMAGLELDEYQGEYLNFESAGIFFGKLSEKRWDIIRTLQSSGETGVRQLARLVNRDVKGVHNDTEVLIELGLIEKTGDKKLICPYRDIHVDMHLKVA